MTSPSFGPLGIARTTDARAIRRAYAQALKQIDQATQQREFEALRAAYEAELAWARAHQDEPQPLAAADVPAPARGSDASPDRASSPRPAQMPASQAPLINPLEPSSPHSETCAHQAASPQPDESPVAPMPQADEPPATDQDAPWARESGGVHEESRPNSDSQHHERTTRAQTDALAAWTWATRLMEVDDAHLAAAWKDLETAPDMQSLGAAYALERALSHQIQHAPGGKWALYQMAAQRFGWDTEQDTQAPALTRNIATENLILGSLEPVLRARHEQTLRAMGRTRNPSRPKVLRWGVRVSALMRELPWHQILRTPAVNTAAWRAQMDRMPSWAYKAWMVLRSLRWIIYFAILAKALHLAFLMGDGLGERPPAPPPAASGAYSAKAPESPTETSRSVYPLIQIGKQPGDSVAYLALLPDKSSVRVVLPNVETPGVGLGPADVLIRVLPDRSVLVSLSRSSGSLALDAAALTAARQARVEGPMPEKGFATRALLEGPRPDAQRAS
ncbi:hypothetical protein ACILG0_23450 [Pseudomonadota bacterium AL_CKDN230030165-1A_HGKHYDSX7]